MEAEKKAKKKVIILGGGVAGLSAAHQLLTHGKDHFDVTIYERRSKGGKARSGFTEKGYPTEHGFRFFPGFYKNITETLKQIPIEGGGNVYANNLVDTSVYTFLFSNKRGRLDVPINIGSSLHSFKVKEILNALKQLREQIAYVGVDITSAGKKKLIDVMLEVYSSCNERIESTYDNISWAELIDAKDRNNQYGKDYENLLATGISKNLVAVRADVANSRTAAKLIGHMFWHIVNPAVASMPADKILNAPTNIAWIDPWVQHLKNLGLTIIEQRRVVSIEFDEMNKIIERIRHDDVENAQHKPWDYYESEEVRAGLDEDSADYFICAMPIERVDEMLQRSKVKGIDIRHCDPTLANFKKLWIDTDWMNGIMFYFDVAFDIADGHITVADEKAAVTMISQLPYWKKHLANKEHTIYGKDKREVKTLLSVIVSNWDAEARYVPHARGRILKNLTREEVIEEIKEIVFRCEIKRNVTIGNYRANLMDAFLDDSVVPYDEDLANPRFRDIDGQFKLYNKERLFINKTHTYHLRPTGYTGFSNFFLASDYIKTNADLGCMDSADEAARRVVNNIFVTEHLAPPCKIGSYDLPSFLGLFDTARKLDYIKFKKGLRYEQTIITRVIVFFLKASMKILRWKWGPVPKIAGLVVLSVLFVFVLVINFIFKLFIKQ